MTQEEKAKAYDEAIERAKEVYDAYRFSMDTSNFNPTDIEYIFPQLAESEDEKIRKWLYDYIERVGKTWGKQPFHYEQILDWIEKQKEQKPWELSEEETKVLDSIIDDYEKAAKSFCGYDGKIGLLRAIRDGEYDLSKQEWSEEDEWKRKELIQYLEEKGDYRTVWMTWLKSLPERFNSKKCNKEMDLDTKLQNRLEEISRNGLENAHTIDFSKEYENSKKILEKGSSSTEWSEEDEKMRQSIIKDIEFERNFTSAATGRVSEEYNEQINWLKLLSLNRKKMNEDVAKLCSNEWSEEDERLLTKLMTFVDIECFDRKCNGEDLIDWLKSFRPRLSDEEIKKIRSEEYTKGINDAAFGGKAWKPSEEQKEALEYVIRDYREDSCNTTANYLQEILDHLKNM